MLHIFDWLIFNYFLELIFRLTALTSAAKSNQKLCNTVLILDALYKSCKIPKIRIFFVLGNRSVCMYSIHCIHVDIESSMSTVYTIPKIIEVLSSTKVDISLNNLFWVNFILQIFDFEERISSFFWYYKTPKTVIVVSIEKWFK